MTQLVACDSSSEDIRNVSPTSACRTWCRSGSGAWLLPSAACRRRSLVGGLLGIITAIMTISGVFQGDEAETTNAKIDACIRRHNLAQASEKVEIETDRLLFRSCKWPPPLGSAPDGFTEVAISTKGGPGRSEAEGLTIADVFHTECADIEVVYLFNNMGTFVAERPFRLTKGDIRRVEGGSVWRPRTSEESSTYSPRRDEFIVLSNSRYILDSVQCV